MAVSTRGPATRTRRHPKSDPSSIFDLTGKVVVVTGASSGIGAHLAAVAAAQGARVALCARRLDHLDDLARRLAAQGADVISVRMDVTDGEAIDAAVSTIEQAFGPIDVLVNNAGTARTVPAVDMTDADWSQVVATNLEGPWRLARRVARGLIAAKQPGVIVNVTSMLGLAGSSGIAAYCASKGGLNNLTRALAVEWARHGIRVNALAPGYIRTELNSDVLDGEAGESLKRRIPTRAFGTLEDLTGPFLLLASDASRFMTGSVLVVDGGQTAWA